MMRTAVVFRAPFDVEVRREPAAAPGTSEVLVRTERSAISAGTELLFYRGCAPRDVPLDASLPALPGAVRYPLRYGYAVLGRVEAAGAAVAPDWLGRRVFCFHPHSGRFTADPATVIPVPDDIPDPDAVFFAAMETAVTLILDGSPALGESVAIFGQGVVGLLTTCLLALHPVRNVVTVDPRSHRREASRSAGAQASLPPEDLGGVLAALGSAGGPATADLVYELSGDPRVLNSALSTAGFDSRVVIGSWYGTRSAPLELGGAFHRDRVRMMSSQVSTLPPARSGRWDRARRGQAAWEMIRRTRPGRFISHSFPAESAAEAYDLLDRGADGVLQVILTYTD